MVTSTGWCATIAMLALASQVTATGQERSISRVKATNDGFRAMIREGDARSQTFRAMLDEIQQSNAIVMVQFGLCANGWVRSCISHVAGDARQRHIRVLINTTATHDRLIAQIAHELHHAIEIVRDPTVTDNAGVMRLYRRIATGACGEGRSSRCETEAALEVEAKVLNELAR